MTEVSYTITNQREHSTELVIEPWAQSFNLGREVQAEIVFISDNVGTIEIQVGEGIISVWAWAGCTAKVSINGVDVTNEFLRRPFF